MSKSKNVLMIGGPADGRWMVASGPKVLVAELGEIDWISEGPIIPKQIAYDVQTFAFLGGSLDVAVAEREFRSGREREGAILRALFQRDVATAMGAYR